MYKLSAFNEIYTSKDGEILVFNRHSGRILKSRSDRFCSVFTGATKEYEQIDPAMKSLIEDGFIVPSNADENSIEYLLNLDSISSNELKLIIIPTYQCNFRCTYCYQDFKTLYMDEMMANRIVRYIKKEIHKYAGLSIGWYGGEPLLCTDLINNLSQELIGICHSVNRKYSATITTNGYLLNDGVFKQMLKNRITLYQITLDGLKNIHDRDRKFANGNGTFDVIVNNLKSISQQIKSGIFKIKIRSNMQSNQYDDYKEFIKYLYDNFGNDNRFVYWFTAVSNYGGDSIKNIKNRLSTFDEVYDLLLSSEYYLDYSPFYYHLIARSCITSARNSYVVAPDCSILKCSVGFDEEYNKVGYITEKGEAIIDKYKLSKWLHYKRDPKSRCASCDIGTSCVDFACPKVNNFPDEGIDCTCNYINAEKIVQLLCRGNYDFIKEY